jgi:uncharacterized protein involved in exopolysaccharide biosynthesis
MSYAPSASGDLDLATLFKILWRRRWLIFICTFVCAAAFVAAAFLVTPVYRVETVVVPGEADNRAGGMGSVLGQFGGLAAMAGLDISAKGSMTEEAIAVLRSREFTETFLRDEGVLPQLYATRWDATSKRWKVPLKDQPTFAQGYKNFDRKVRKIDQDKKRGLIIIQVEWKDREVAAYWANQLVKRLNTEMRARAIRQSDASISYLERELAATNLVETRQAVSRLMEAQINQRMYANVAQEYAFRVVDPALAPDPKDVIWPNKPLMLLLGTFLGFFAAVTFAFISWFASDKKSMGATVSA